MSEKPSIQSPNKSVLECPDCGKPLVNIGSRVVRIHPVAKFIHDHHSYLLMAWCVGSTVFFVSGVMGYGKFLAFALVGSYLFGAFVLYILVRLFSLWRITECLYCGFEEKQKLGRSSSG